MPAMASHQTHANALVFFPTFDTWPYRFDRSDNLMARNAGISYSGKSIFDRKRIGVANAAGFDPDSDLTKSGLDNRLLDDLEFAGIRHLHCLIFLTHRFSPTRSSEVSFAFRDRMMERSQH
jgi:hypothetical protein